MVFRIEFNKIVLTSAVVAFSSGCASFLSSETELEREDGFQKPASATSGLNPLPAEIAHDIAEITEGGEVVFRNGGVDSSVPAEEWSTLAEMKSKDEVSKLGPLSKEFVSNETSAGPLARLGADKGLDRQIANLPQISKSVRYEVVKGDTLMKISFVSHANFLRWREIYARNRKLMPHWSRMPVGISLTIDNVSYSYIQKEGEPYLIQPGDSLKTIAKALYNDEAKWKELMANNPQLIKEPNKLYAGFILYYRK